MRLFYVSLLLGLGLQGQAAVTVNDECSFIRDAIAELPVVIGGEVTIPAGTFTCEAPIFINRNNIKLWGAGEHKTVLQAAPGRFMPLIVIGSEETHMAHLVKHNVYGERYDSWEPVTAQRVHVSSDEKRNDEWMGRFFNLGVTAQLDLDKNKPVSEELLRSGEKSYFISEPEAKGVYWIRQIRGVIVSDLTLDGGIDIDSLHNNPELTQKILQNECYHLATNTSGSCDGDSTSIRNNGITIRGGNGVTVSNVTIQRMSSGGLVTEKQCHKLKIINVTSRKNYFDGFAGYQTDFSLFRNLHLNENRGAGISIDINFDNNLLDNVEITNTGDVGIFMRYSSRNLFRNLNITFDAETTLNGESSRQYGEGSFGVFMGAVKDAPVKTTCPLGNVFDHPRIVRARGVAFIQNDNCIYEQTRKERLDKPHSIFFENRDEVIRNTLIDYDFEGTVVHPRERLAPSCIREAVPGSLSVTSGSVCH